MTDEQILARYERTQKMHINRLVIALADREFFGPSAIQRVCRIGYNNALHIAERAVNEGLLHRVGDYQFAITDKGKEIQLRISNL